MLTISITATFGTKRGYIANPYWPAQAKVIDIIKQSGMARARSTANRRKALEEHLQLLNMTLAQFEALQKQAAVPFYMEGNEIVIPVNCVESFLVSTCDQIRSNSRPCDKEQVRSRFDCSPWTTGKEKADGDFERFVVVKSGTGAKLSNQRALRSSPYINDFTAHGTISYDEDYVDTPTLKRAIEWGGQFVGIGSCRKMGWGRFVLTKFETNALKIAAE